MEQCYLLLSRLEFWCTTGPPSTPSPGGDTELFCLGRLQSKLLWTCLYKSRVGHTLGSLGFTARNGGAGSRGSSSGCALEDTAKEMHAPWAAWGLPAPCPADSRRNCGILLSMWWYFTPTFFTAHLLDVDAVTLRTSTHADWSSGNCFQVVSVCAFCPF